MFDEAMTVAQLRDILSAFDPDNAIKYYKEFRDKVLRGEIPVCKEVSMEMNRIDAIITNPGAWYDRKENRLILAAKETGLDDSDVYF